MVTGELVNVSKVTLVVYDMSVARFDDGGAQHIRRRQSSPMRLVFWVELSLTLYMLWAPVDLGPRG